MTALILDVRHGDDSSKFADSFLKRIPPSTLITVARFIDPDMIVKVQGVALIDVV